MLPSLLDLTVDLDRVLVYHLRDRIKASDPTLQVFSSEQHEGSGRFIQDEDGTKRVVDYKRSETPVELPKAEYLRMGMSQ